MQLCDKESGHGVLETCLTSAVSTLGSVWNRKLMGELGCRGSTGPAGPQSSSSGREEKKNQSAAGRPSSTLYVYPDGS